MSASIRTYTTHRGKRTLHVYTRIYMAEPVEWFCAYFYIGCWIIQFGVMASSRGLWLQGPTLPEKIHNKQVARKSRKKWQRDNAVFLILLLYLSSICMQTKIRETSPQTRREGLALENNLNVTRSAALIALSNILIFRSGHLKWLIVKMEKHG